MRELPFTIDNTEGDVFVGRPSHEVQEHGFVVPRFLDNFVGRGF